MGHWYRNGHLRTSGLRGLGGFFWFRIKRGDGLFEPFSSSKDELFLVAERILSSEEV
jgi:hypothetical protein